MLTTLSQRAEELGIRYFLVSFTDLFGTLRAKLIPASAIDSACRTGAGFAGFATWLDMTPADPDMFALPDPDSLIQLPWKPEIGWLTGDLVMNGQPVPQAPRTILKKTLQRAADMGYELRTGVECEFFVITPDGSAVADAADSQIKPCYDQQSLVRQYDLIAEICDAMQELGWNPYQNDHEDANGQFEMNWQYADALLTADRHVFFKYLVRSLAEKHGLRATFMPKPFSQLTGNGCHMHVSLWDRNSGRNLFLDENGRLGLSSLAFQFVGGVLHSAEAMSAFTNPTINSWRRLNAPVTTSGATWSPRTISFGGNNRTHMIRIPDSGRFELRLADGSANPYLLAAAVIEAGLDGMAHNRDPGPLSDTNAYIAPPKEARRLPETLLDALRALEASPVYAERLGAEVVTSYVRLRRNQWREYSSHVSEWEREHTLDC
ncbi:MAG: type III glutamate--ammonia ligase [Planctomycetaceae bacterium]|nr:type III glutamate--ammonia ligase [Planctomycetaceae bacterium]